MYVCVCVCVCLSARVYVYVCAVKPFDSQLQNNYNTDITHVRQKK